MKIKIILRLLIHKMMIMYIMDLKNLQRGIISIFQCNVTDIQSNITVMEQNKKENKTKKKNKTEIENSKIIDSIYSNKSESISEKNDSQAYGEYQV